MLRTLQHRHGHPLPIREGIGQRRPVRPPADQSGAAGVSSQLQRGEKPPARALPGAGPPRPTSWGCGIAPWGQTSLGGGTASTVPSSLLEGPQLTSEHPCVAEDAGKRFESFVSPRELAFTGCVRQPSSGSGRRCGFWKPPLRPSKLRGKSSHVHGELRDAA